MGYKRCYIPVQPMRKTTTYCSSTHDNPRKSKTKGMAFLKKKWDLKKLALDDKELPWVNSVKHLGTTLTDILDMG